MSYKLFHENGSEGAMCVEPWASPGVVRSVERGAVAVCVGPSRQVWINPITASPIAFADAMYLVSDLPDRGATLMVVEKSQIVLRQEFTTALELVKAAAKILAERKNSREAGR
ncbi:MAG: hypothetical protein JSS20_22025 [Proteobacteria bacterium]|nr:hypothetical protein [Pseudomonadota bacterium]